MFMMMTMMNNADAIDAVASLQRATFSPLNLHHQRLHQSSAVAASTLCSSQIAAGDSSVVSTACHTADDTGHVSVKEGCLFHCVCIGQSDSKFAG